MGIVTNTANATYKYKSKNFSKSATSDFDIIDNVLIFTKQFVPNIGVSGDTTQVVLTCTLPSTVPTPITNLILTDVLPIGLTFVTGSVIVDGVAVPSANPATGINVGSLNSGQTKVVTFNATVD